MFGVKHHWLIPTISFEVIELFRKVLLNIDCDIQIALYNNETYNWTILDLYNPASEHGGEMKYTPVGFFNRKDGYRARIKESKYYVRKNLTGVLFKSVVVVFFTDFLMIIRNFKSVFYSYMYHLKAN